MRNVLIVFITILLIPFIFLFMLSLSDLLQIGVGQEIFSVFLGILANTPLAFITKGVHSLQTNIPTIMSLCVSGLISSILLYVAYVIFAGKVRAYRDLPQEMKADTLYRMGKIRRALRLYKKLGRWDMAAEIYRKQRNYGKSARMLEKLGNESHAVAAEMYEQMGDMERARSAYMSAGRFCAEKESWEKAANFFLKGGNKNDALDCLEQQLRDIQNLAPPDHWREKCQRIIKLSEQLGDPIKAAKYCELINDIPGAVQNYSRGGNHLKAAQILKKSGDADRALDILGRIGPEQKQYSDGLVMKARILAQKEKFADAVKHYLSYFKQAKVGDENLEDFFEFGLCLEKMGKLDKAREVFVRIHDMRPYFMNADERIDTINKKQNEAHTMVNLLEQDMETKTSGMGDEFQVKIGERYTELEELGRGGAGIVYQAKDKLLDRTVAMKLLPANVTKDPIRLQSFFKEAKTIAKLNHPNIVSIYDVLKVENNYYLVMEFINGVSVEKLLDAKNHLSLRLSLYIARYVLLALSYAHRHHVIHQDIKPANIMMTDDKTVKLTDFGVALLKDELPDYSSDIVVGTPKYISPEQLQGTPVDERCDLYSFGVTLYEMITGSLPYPADGILRHHLVTPPTPPSQVNPGIPSELETVILRCLEKKRENRYNSARELYEDIKVIAQQLEVSKKRDNL